jgi:hypothetical protein
MSQNGCSYPLQFLVTRYGFDSKQRLIILKKRPIFFIVLDLESDRDVAVFESTYLIC